MPGHRAEQPNCRGLRKWTRSCTLSGSTAGASGRMSLPGGMDELPDGTVITAAGEAYTLAQGRAFQWTARGYQGPVGIPRPDAVLTPPSTLGALRAGYRPVLHPSIDTMQAATSDA